MTSIQIATIDVELLDIPLHAPFGISGGVQTRAANVLVALTLTDGTRGYGEAAPLPSYNGETQEDALTVLRAAHAWLPGRPCADWHALAAEFRNRGGARCGSAQCAFETALLDALNRRDRVPLWKFFGGAETSLETDMTITTGSIDDAAAAARTIRTRGFRSIKVKIGGIDSVTSDLGRILAIQEAAPGMPLILDANAGLSRADATQLIHKLKTSHITPALLEQWLAKDDLEGMRLLHDETGWTVAADESVTTAADARHVAAAGAAQVINIKLMKAGIVEALNVAAVARSAGLDLMIGGNVESILAMTTSACFATGIGGFRFADLDTPLFLAENPFSGGFQLAGGHISVAQIDAGHGVSPKKSPHRASGEGLKS